MRHIQQRRTFEVLLPRREQLGEVRRLLLALDATDESKHVSTSNTESVVRFNTDRNDEQLAGLLAKLTDSGIAISQFREVALDLEDAFLSVTSQTPSAKTDSDTNEPTAAIPAATSDSTEPTSKSVENA
jgi:hypothetical protein